MILTESLDYLLIVFLFVGGGLGTISSQAQIPVPVRGCKVLANPGRYNGKMIIVKGRYTAGFERSDLTFGCPGSIRIELSLNPTDRRKYRFLTEQATIEAMSKLPPGEYPGGNLTARQLRYALVTVIGLFRCNLDIPDCKGVPDNGSIIVKSMQFDTPMSESAPFVKPTTSENAPYSLQAIGGVTSPLHSLPCDWRCECIACLRQFVRNTRKPRAELRQATNHLPSSRPLSRVTIRE